MPTTTQVWLVLYAFALLSLKQAYGGKCDKCNLPAFKGGCKCDSKCNCKPGTGGEKCDKCSIPVNQGGCKCDKICNCLVPSSPVQPSPSPIPRPRCDQFLASAPSGISWRQAWSTVYTSYPCCCKRPMPKGCSTAECADYSGCDYQGMFEAVGGQQTEAWVQNHAIVAYFAVRGKSPTYATLKNKFLYVRNPKSPSRVLRVQVLDTCADSDCDGCCTENANFGGGILIDLEYYTAVCLYGDGKVAANEFQAIQWQLV